MATPQAKVTTGMSVANMKKLLTHTKKHHEELFQTHEISSNTKLEVYSVHDENGIIMDLTYVLTKETPSKCTSYKLDKEKVSNNEL
jgi:hypothetical protein